MPRIERPVLVAALVAAGVLAALGLAVIGTERVWVFEAAAGLGMLFGLGLASGALDRVPRKPPTVGTATHATPALRAAVSSRLSHLDPLENRRLELGDPWPSLVVGPTGVAVVAPASSGHGEVTARLTRVADEVERRLAGTSAVRLPVRPLLVVEANHAARSDVVGEVPRVTIDHLLETLARGPLAPMSAVSTAYGRLAGDLAPDLRAAS